MDESPDYTTYSLDQLEHALRHTDEELYPLRFKQIADEIDRRRIEPIGKAATARARRRIPVLALCLSLYAPGLGQLYNGQLWRGLVLAAAFSVAALPLSFVAGLLRTFFGLLSFLVAFAIFLAVYIFVVVDALRGAAKTKEFRLRPYNKWFVYIGIIAAFHFIPWPPDLQKQGLKNTLQTYVMKGVSMAPTLALEDRIVVDVKYYESRRPTIGDIVVFPRPDKATRTVIDRVVAVEGESVEFRDKTVYVNGKKIADPWGRSSDNEILSAEVSERDKMSPVRIPDGFVFVLGDNRDSNFDSRFFGPVKRETILGKPLYIYWAKKITRLGMTVR
jgi:signal peptidase I